MLDSAKTGVYLQFCIAWERCLRAKNSVRVAVPQSSGGPACSLVSDLVLTECRAAVVRPLSHSYLVPRSKQLIGLMTLNRQMPRSNTNSRSLTFCGVEELNNVTRMSENTISRMKRKIIAPAIVLFQVHEVAN